MAYFVTHHPQDDFGYAQFISYGAGASMRGSSACIWMIPGTWKEDEC